MNELRNAQSTIFILTTYTLSPYEFIAVALARARILPQFALNTTLVNMLASAIPSVQLTNLSANGGNANYSFWSGYSLTFSCMSIWC